MMLPYIIIAALIAFIIYSIVRSRYAYGDSYQKEAGLQGMLQEADLILQNVNTYYLLINKDFIVKKTNYYLLNQIPVDNETKRVGDLLRCRNAMEGEGCGTCECCKICGVRATISKAFYQKKNFNKLNASMKLLSQDNKQVTPCDVLVSGTYLKSGVEEQMVLTVYDITELKNVERLLSVEKENAISADKLKSAFIANMSHEIRTPLNAIVGFSGLLATASNEEEKNMYADIISQNNERLLQLISDILDLSQIEAGASGFEHSEFDVNDLLRELYGIFGLKWRDNRTVALICESQVEPILIYSARERVMQVMTNLIHNAMKFTKEGEIRFGCHMKLTDEIYFYVSDTGIGIPEAEQNKIFSRFTKLDREIPGTGLGLTLSQTIIQNLGGRIGVESEVNKGSTFWFILPLVP